MSSHEVCSLALFITAAVAASAAEDLLHLDTAESVSPQSGPGRVWPLSKAHDSIQATVLEDRTKGTHAVNHTIQGDCVLQEADGPRRWTESAAVAAAVKIK